MRRQLLLRWQVTLLFMCYLMICTPVHTAAAQTVNSFDITLKELGYDERQLTGPRSSARYYFSLPANWKPQTGGYLELHLDYVVSGQEGYPPAFLKVRLNDSLLHTEVLGSPAVLKLRLDIPPDVLLLSEDQYVNALRLEFEVDEECEKALLVSLTVKPTSFLHLAYQERPLQLDLALYPKPVYQQRAFELSPVRFVLPPEPSSTDLRAAAMIAARLGRLTSASLPISATLYSDLLAGTVPQEHLIVIGRPDAHPLIRQLDLPVSVAKRHLALSSEMPAMVKPGDTISYTLTVESTSAVTESLTVEDRIPIGGTLLACSSQCIESRPGVVRWEIGPLAPGEQASTTVKVRLSGLTLPGVDAVEPPGAAIEHTATLFDNQGNVLNVDTLSAQVGTATSEKQITSADKQSSYFFVHDNQGVAERDGLVQEIVSPWSPAHVALVVTGLDEEALLKAAQALSASDRFPGLSGRYAIVQATHPISESVALSPEDISLASLGYTDDSIRSLYLEYLEYEFHVPPGWSLSNEAYLALHFAHGAALSDTKATLEVQLNDLPVGSIYLDESNSNSWTAFPLPTTASQIGSNRIRVQVSADIEDQCRYITNDRYWLTVYADSFLHLPRKTVGLRLDLNNFPYPFNSDSDLRDVIFLLPERPALPEIEGVLRLASLLGSGAGGDVFLPQVALGGQPDAEPWAGYHLIAVGLPTNNRYLAAANDKLPQPFWPGTNEIMQKIDRVIYRLPPGVSLGYVQELFSPWDEDRAMLAVTGTTDEGLVWALTSLTDVKLQRELTGNLALIRDRQVRSIDTREKTADEVVAFTQVVVPSVTPIVMLEPTPTATVSPTPTATLTPTPTAVAQAASDMASPPVGRYQPVWLIPLLILSVLTVLVAVGIAIRQARS